ncbi:MAG: hypothetical protein NTV61_00765 [Candidatus Bathyarchaeota archaeon]|nr:hypothetical protein [Candidatus Bathyarchaeota archaeon]
MSNHGAIGFGGFLLGLGAGYIVFRELSLVVNSIAWILVIIGATIILSALIRYASPGLGLHKVMGGLAGGLVFALFLTQGFNFFTGLVTIDNGYMPYTATTVQTYTGASSTDSVYLRLGSMNGQITLSTWDKDEYSIVATITARGSTQAVADNNLATLNKELSKDESGAQQKLTLVYSSTTLINNPYQINVEVKLPASAKLDLDLTTSNAVVTVNNVNGGSVVVHTSNGALYLTNVKADTLRGSTSNAAITGTVDAATCTLDTSNGAITLQIFSTMSGKYTLETSNARVEVTGGAAAEYKLAASTSNGDVTFTVPNMTYTQNTKTSKAGQTVGYDAAQTKIGVSIQTSNADVTVRRNVSII